jgi:nickel/cobalt transporter (NicO) family protein
MSEIPATFAAAFTLGLFHSLEPSHAKVVLASYFLNHKRTVFEAVAFAFVVTVAHTAVIYLLAVVGYLFVPTLLDLAHQEDFFEKWSELLGGILMTLIGAWMIWSEFKVKFHRDSCCDHAHATGHFFHHHAYGHDHPAPSSLRHIFVLGFCSGAVPCMSGLAVLVLAWTTASVAKGLSLVAVFSLGLGLVVLVMCILVQQMARVMDRYWKSSARWSRFLPILSASIILGTGVVFTIRGIHEVMDPESEGHHHSRIFINQDHGET